MIRVNIGRRKDLKIQKLINMNQEAGYDVYVECHQENPDFDTFFIVLQRSSSWRASDAEFQPMSSGLYIFRNNQAVLVGESQK